MTALLVLLVAIAALLVALSGSSTRVLREYESAVVFRLGRLLEQEGPGLTFLIPVIDSMVCVAESATTARPAMSVELAQLRRRSPALAIRVG